MKRAGRCSVPRYGGQVVPGLAREVWKGEERSAPRQPEMPALRRWDDNLSAQPERPRPRQRDRV